MRNRANNINDKTVKGRPASPEEIAYRDGYVRGRATEETAQRRYQRLENLQAEQIARSRANESASSGILLGLLLAIIAACIGGVAYYIAREPEAATTDAPVERETTIIERTIENSREVIQNPPEVNLPTIEAPDIEVNVPELPGADSSAPTEAAGDSDTSGSAESTENNQAVDSTQ